MTITLRPEHEQLIAQVIQTGAYQNPEEVIGGLWKCSSSKMRGCKTGKA